MGGRSADFVRGAVYRQDMTRTRHQQFSLVALLAVAMAAAGMVVAGAFVDTPMRSGLIGGGVGLALTATVMALADRFRR